MKKETKTKASERLILERNLRENAKLDKEELLEKMQTTIKGLDSEEAEERIDDFGKNIITGRKQKNMFMRLLDSIINPFNVILIIIAIITLLTDVILTKDNPEYLTVIIIFALVFVSSGIAFVQGEKTHNAVEKLSDLVTNNATILRDGNWEEILMEEIVPGDIVKLSAGDMIPADIRFLLTKDTLVTQAALTGE